MAMKVAPMASRVFDSLTGCGLKREPDRPQRPELALCAFKISRSHRTMLSAIGRVERMSYLQETKDAGRHVFPDLARAWALCSALPWSMLEYFAWPAMKGGYAAGGLETGPRSSRIPGRQCAVFDEILHTVLFHVRGGVCVSDDVRREHNQSDGIQRRRIASKFSLRRYWRRIAGPVLSLRRSTSYCFSKATFSSSMACPG